VTVPGMGDDIQAIKAGIMEIGNIFVVNKSEREGSRKTVRELLNLIELGARRRNGGDWEPLIVETEAIKAVGIEKLYEAIEKHRAHLLATHAEKWRGVLEKRARIQLLGVLKDQAFRTILDRIESRGDSIDEMVQKIVDKESDPYTIVQEIIGKEMA